MTDQPNLYTKIKEAFELENWEFREIEDKNVIEAQFEAHHTKVPLHAQSFEELMAISVMQQPTLRCRRRRLLARARARLSVFRKE